GNSPSLETGADCAVLAEVSSAVSLALSVEAALASPFKYASMSSLVVRPFLPEATTALMFTPFSRAYLRTEGVALTRLFSSTSSSADDCVVAAASEFSSLAGSASASSVDSLLSLPLNSISSASGASILTIVSPTTATVPSSTSTSSTVPDTGDGISTTDLSF